MTRHVRLASLLLVLAAAPPSLRAQPAPHPLDAQPASPAPAIAVAPDGVTQELRLRDGTTVVGRVTAVDGGQVTFVTRGGATLTVAVADVVAVTTVGGRDTGRGFWKDDPNPTRLFFGPTARPLAKGEVYLGVYEVVMPFVQVGVTDRLSVGGGTPLVFFGDGDRPFWFTPKFTLVARERTQVAVGAMHMLNVDDESVGIAYGAVTRGSRDSAVTLGVGVAYERFEDASPPVVMLGAEHRVRRNLKLMTENYLFDQGGLVSAGIRFLTGRLSADLALAAPVGVDDLVVFPMVNFVWTFQ